MKKKWLYALILLQALVMLGMAGSSYATARFGEEIRLKTVPLDPRDVLYGDYVILSYGMSQLNRSLWQGFDSYPSEGTVVYTVLAPDEQGYYEPVAVYRQRPALQENEVALRGKVQYGWNDAMQVRYGLERYYIPEGTGQELEEQSDNLAVTVKIAPWGQTRITDVRFAD